MSFPVPAPVHGHDETRPACVEVFPAHENQVGEVTVRRSLPTRARRMVGPWCFADHMGPAQVEGRGGINVGPHPHMGLQTVTWLVEGEILHRDSLGSEQTIRPGQLNLMSAGRGVSHSEESTSSYSGVLEGIQLWLAQTDDTRWDEPAFRHHTELPSFDAGRSVGTVVIGGLGGVTSPEAQYGTDAVAVDLDVRGSAEVPLDADHEYALVVLRGRLQVVSVTAEPGVLFYLGRDRASLEIAGTGRAMLIGGRPFASDVLMWWNLVGRSWDEMAEGARAWNAHDERFGTVDSSLERHVAPEPPRAT